MQSSLSRAHNENRRTFAAMVSEDIRGTQLRERIIVGTYTRIRSLENEPVSPSNLSPVSPSISRSTHATESPAYGGWSAHHSPYAAYSPPSPGIHPGSCHLLVKSSGGYTKGHSVETELAVLYTPGYRLHKGLDEHGNPSKPATDAYRAACKFCDREGAITALILKRPENQEWSDHFPAPGQLARYRYPFLLGSYPDVDIVSHEICCETCSIWDDHAIPFIYSCVVFVGVFVGGDGTFCFVTCGNCLVSE